MMNYEQIKAMAEILEENFDAYLSYDEEGIGVTLIDCDEDWYDCEYNDGEAVDAFIEALEKNCIKEEHDWGWDGYYFDGFMVSIGYVSSDA